MENEGIIFGVCAMIADDTKIHPWIIRLAFILTMSYGSIFIYGIIALCGYTKD